jgi:hypothetical protein
MGANPTVLPVITGARRRKKPHKRLDGSTGGAFCALRTVA